MGAKLTHFAKIVSTIATLTAVCSNTMASGFRVPEISILGLGTSNAVVANTSEIGAMAYNPATMAFHDGYTLSTGLVNLKYDLAATPDNGTYTENIGKHNFNIPNFYISSSINDELRWGLGMNSPFGLETKWPDNTFPEFAGSDSLDIATSKIKMINLNPNLSYRAGPNTSLAIGVDYYKVLELQFNSQSTVIQGSGDDFGWNVGLIQQFDKFNIGLSYRSAVKVPLHGSLSSVVPVTAEIEFPWMAQIGINYQMSPEWNLELDLEKTGWSTFDQLVIKGAPTGDIVSTNNWEDVMAYRLGAIYQWTDKTQLRFGYSLDETPQIDRYYSARIADSDRQLFSIGFKHEYDNNWSVEGGYMYVTFDDRTVNSSTTYTAGVTSEANGTEAYNGTYEASVNLIGIGVTAKF